MSVHISIDSSALSHNLKCIQVWAPNSRVLAIIKSDAYGHGQLRTAQALSGADALGVASIDAAVVLRQHGIDQPLVLLSGFLEASQLKLIAKYHLDCVIHNWDQLDVLVDLPKGANIRVWLKVDTGMHRLGFDPSEFQQALRVLDACQGVKEIIIMSHLACAGDLASQHNIKQLDCFRALTANLAFERSMLNSAGILNFPSHHYDWVRPGLALYGASPVDNRSSQDLGLRPAMEVSARIIALKPLKAHEPVGYECDYVATCDMQIAVVGLGYADGYPRCIKYGATVLLKDRRCLVIGRVSMNMLCIDVSSVPNVLVGDYVTLWGQGLSVNEVAICAGTIPHDLMCSMRGTF